jgi:hypothetical protein
MCFRNQSLLRLCPLLDFPACYKTLPLRSSFIPHHNYLLFTKKRSELQHRWRSGQKLQTRGVCLWCFLCIPEKTRPSIHVCEIMKKHLRLSQCLGGSLRPSPSKSEHAETYQHRCVRAIIRPRYVLTKTEDSQPVTFGPQNLASVRIMVDAK